jgi:hypothetical protein
MNLKENCKEPYYCMESKYPLKNKEKAKLGEEAFAEALQDYKVLMNITYGKPQKDIDHIVLTSKYLILNECKNTDENFFVWHSWFTSHVVKRFEDAYPIVKWYARGYGYSVKNIVLTLTIPKLNTEPIVRKALQGLKIHVIETGEQLLDNKSKKNWYNPIRNQILFVINNCSSNTPYSPSRGTSTDSKKKMSKEEDAQFWKPFKEYHWFPFDTYRYCEYCTEYNHCHIHSERKNSRKYKKRHSQTTLPLRTEDILDIAQCKKEMKIAREIFARIRIDLLDAARKCANKRLFKYVKLGQIYLFNFPKDLHDPQKPRLKPETKSSEDCFHRIEIICTQRREPVDLCTCVIPSENKKELLAFLEENNNECNCNETSKKYCPYINSCDEIRARKECPETIDKYS